MTHEEFRREAMYQMTMKVCRAMLCQGIMSADEYGKAEQMMAEKYLPIFGKMCSRID